MYQLTVQRVAPKKISAPSSHQLKNWAKAVLKKFLPSAELNIRIVGKAEMIELNSTYRHKKKPTNVLSFPFDMPEELDDSTPILGDIVICAEVVNSEASEQNKSQEEHWAHMIVHGTLHLLGYDHEKKNDAAIMELQEITILESLGFSNPYSIEKQR